jgi:Tfp pilus assembly protein PilO
MKTVFTASKRTVLIAACILFFEIVIGAVVVSLALRSLNAKKQELARARQELSVVSNEANQLTELRRRKALYASRLARLEKPLAEGKGERVIPSLMVQLYDLSKRTGVSISSVKPGEVVSPQPAAGSAQQTSQQASQQQKPRLPYEARKIGLDLTGTFAQLHAFLEGLSRFPKPVEVGNFQLRPVDQEPGRAARLGISIELTCYAVYKEGQSEAPKG